MEGIEKKSQMGYSGKYGNRQENLELAGGFIQT